MILDQLIQGVVVAAGLMLSLAYYPQLYRIWKERSAEGVSVPSFLMFSVGTTIWLLYGLYTENLILITGFMFGVVGSWLVLLSALFFRRKSVQSEPSDIQ